MRGIVAAAARDAPARSRSLPRMPLPLRATCTTRHAAHPTSTPAPAADVGARHRRRLRRRGAAGRGADDHDRHRRPGRRRGDDHGRRLRAAGVPRARPRATAACRSSLVVSEIFGVHEHIADVARRFAKLGYLAIAPELFVRQGDAQGDERHQHAVRDDRLEGARRAGDGRPRRQRRLGQARTAATPRGSASPASAGAGASTWLYAAHNPALKAGVAWYGRLVGATDAAAADASDRRRRRAARAGARPLRRRRHRHPARHGRADEGGAGAAAALRRRRSRVRRLPARASTPSTPTTGRATTRPRPTTAGSAASPGCARTASHERRSRRASRVAARSLRA